MFDLNKAVTENPTAKSLADSIFSLWGGANSVNLNDGTFTIFNDYTGTADMPLIFNGAIQKGVPFSKKILIDGLQGLLFGAWAVYHNIPQSVLDEWQRLLQAGADDNQKKKFWEKLKESVSNTFNQVSGAVTTTYNNATSSLSDFKNKLQTFLNNAPQNIAFAPILPLMPAMRNQLNKRGFSVSGLGVYDVAKMFVDKIINNSSSYEFAHLDPASAAAFASSPEGQAMIRQILDFFLTLAGKETLSSNEKEMLKDANTGIDDVTKKVDSGSVLKILALVVGVFLLVKFLK